MNTGACLLGYIYKFKPSNVVDEVGKLYYSIVHKDINAGKLSLNCMVYDRSRHSLNMCNPPT